MKNLFWKIAAKMKPLAWPRLDRLTVRRGGLSFGCVTKLAVPSCWAGAADPLVLVQQVVGGDHGAAADRQRCGEGPVGWQRLAGRQFALVDQPA